MLPPGDRVHRPAPPDGGGDLRAGRDRDRRRALGRVGRAPLNERVAAVLGRFDDFCREWFGADGNVERPAPERRSAGTSPPAVLVHGDTSSAMAAALAAFQLRIPVDARGGRASHRRANLTPFPEELNRRLISKIACFHFAPTATNQENLVRENIPEHQIFVTGNTGIDALQWASGLETPFRDPARGRRPRWRPADRGGDRASPRELGGGLAGIAAGIARLAASHPEVRFVVPIHPNPLVRQQLGKPLGGIDNVLLTEPMGYAIVRPPAGPLRPGDHRFRGDPGGGALARQAGPGGPRDDRADRGHRGRDAVPGRHRSRSGSRPRASDCSTIRLHTGGCPRPPTPTATGAPRRGSSPRSTICYQGGEPPSQFGSGYERTAVLAAAGYDGGPGPRPRCRRTSGAPTKTSSAPRRTASRDRAVADLSLPFQGLPAAWTDLFSVALAVIVAMLAWTAVLFVRGRRGARLTHPRLRPMPIEASPGSSWCRR